MHILNKENNSILDRIFSLISDEKIMFVPHIYFIVKLMEKKINLKNNFYLNIFFDTYEYI